MSIFADELMVEARKNPEKYEGRRYEAECALIDSEGRTYKELTITGGKLTVSGHWAYINSNTLLTEKSRSVDFMTAANSLYEMKPDCDDCDSCGQVYMKLSGVLHALGQMDRDSALKLINGKWLIRVREG
jgi:hypothetical protein